MARARRLQAILGGYLRSFRDHLGAGRRRRSESIGTCEELCGFLASRASHVAQTSLYGYLRTRAGARYPELFADAAFAKSINIAKWYVWLACVSDLSVYTGGLVAQRAPAGEAAVRLLMQGAVDAVLRATGIPPDAGEEFYRLTQKVRARVEACDWLAVTDDETPFSESPAAVVEWAPVLDDLKQLDQEVVRNSVRFRWHEVRRELRASLAAADLVAALASSTAPPTNP